jgi:hypothetical protein
MSNTFESRPSCASEPTDLIAARIHVREAVERYFHAIDARHVAQLRACFTDWITVRIRRNRRFHNHYCSTSHQESQMFKRLLFIKRRPDLPHEQFRDYYEHVHVPLVRA